MSWAGMEFKEIRFVVEEELTQCYVLIQALGDCPLGVQGWHHKTFPKSKPIVDIVANIDKDNPVLWGQEAPNDRIPNY